MFFDAKSEKINLMKSTRKHEITELLEEIKFETLHKLVWTAK